MLSPWDFSILSFSFHHISGSSHVLLGCGFFPQPAIAEEPSLSKISRQWHNPFPTQKDLCYLVFLDKLNCLPNPAGYFGTESLLEPPEYLKIWFSCDSDFSKVMQTNSRCAIIAIISQSHLYVVFRFQKTLGHSMVDNR